MWTMAQRNRLAIEHQLLQREGLTQFGVYHDTSHDGYYAWGETRTNAANAYSLWIPIPRGFPEDCPPLYIYRPNPLWGHGGRSVNSYGLSHAMHTLGNGPNGEVQICHWRSDRWHAAITLSKVLLKGLIWLEALEQHRATGEPITRFVGTMQ